MLHHKVFRHLLSLFLIAALLGTLLVPAAGAGTSDSPAQTAVAEVRGVHSGVVIDSDPTGGYEGDYVVIYNPSTSSSTSYSTGTMTGLIETSVGTNANVNANLRKIVRDEARPYKIDVDPMMAKAARNAVIKEPIATRASYSVGSTKTFNIYSTYSPTGSGSVQFKCLYVGQHCYIWTPTSSSNNTYPLDTIDATFAKKAADEFDSKFDLMQSSFGNHTNGSSGDGKLHMLYYNINDGWQPGQGYVAGFFYQVDISNNGLPILNIDTYPGVYYKNSNGNEYKRMDDTYNTMVHEYQHLINYSNTSGMSTWLNECFSAAAEEICYPGSSLVGRIQSWENYYYTDNNDWLNPPAEFQYQSSYNLHNGYSMYSWNNNLSDILALYSQVSFFAQYLYTRFGNSIYRQISNKFTSSDVSAITNATGVSCSDLVRDFRIAVTANAAQSDYNGIYGFKVQNGYDPSKYNNVESPYDLLAPVVFTGSSCSIKGGGSITVKPVNGVYNPPSGANSNLKYFGIKVSSTPAPTYTVTAVSNNTSYGTVSISGNVITATPKTGYYVTGYTVTSGTATVTQNGNTFTVNPSSDCTVRINFAAKTQYTVTLKANGSTYNTLSCYQGESVTLPATATAVSGYSFVGWAANTVSETTSKPTVYSGSYTPSGNVTLYAVYSRTEGNGGANVYQLVTSTPSNWAGNYVITNGNSTSMYVLKGVTPSSNGAEIENSSNAATYSSTGMSLSNNALSNVSDAYVFTLAATGSYYTVQSASTGAYVGMNSSSYLAGYTTYNSSYCRWTPAVNSSGAAQLKNFANGSYPYFGFSTSNKYFWSASTNNANVLRLWKATATGTTYYTTSPSASTPEPETTYTVSFSVPNGVTAPTSQTVTANSYITLPTAGAPSGYTFLGWVTAAVNNSTTQPGNILTGSYKVTGNVTLRALYSYSSGGGANVYQLVTSTPSTWTGSYVITNGSSTSMYVLTGVSMSSNGAEIENTSNATAYSSTGMSLSNNALTNVANAYVFTVEANGSYYTVKNASTGTYVGMNSSSYLAGYTSYNSTYCRWTPAVNSSGAAQLKNAANGSYPYFGFNSSKHYFWSASTKNANVLRLWKLSTSGETTYYTTVVD